MDKKVLIIEDYPATVEMIISYMESLHGYALDFALDGPSGLAKIDSNKPDVVLLDIMMPGMSGLDVCKKLKGDPKTSKIPIIIVSAKVSDDDIKAGMAAGAEEYLTKPFDMNKLVELIKKYI